MADKKRERFLKLRATYIVKKGLLAEHERALRGKYGGEWMPDWLKADDKNRLTRRRDAVDKAGSSLFDFVTEISPRDWGCGVPARWVYEELSYEDATRPLNEKLSVVPPLAYGATEHMR